MGRVLVINDGEFEFTKFSQAVSVLEDEFDYRGLAWEMVKASEDFEVLWECLKSDGLVVEIVYE